MLRKNKIVLYSNIYYIVYRILIYRIVRPWDTPHFTRADTLVERLKKASRDDLPEGKLETLAKYKFLIIDELWYLPFDNEDVYCFFQLVSRRYGRNSTIFTSNKSCGEWGEIFHDNVIAAAVLDRILYHCTTINIKWESYRLKERKMHGLNSCKVNIISEESGETEGNIKYGWRILDRR